MSKPTLVIVGANGTLGPYVISAVLSDTFKNSYNMPIRVVTRDSSKTAAIFPNSKDDIKYYNADIATGEGLKVAFEGADVVVNLLGIGVTHNTVTDAAAAAKVKLYFPSEFGIDYVNSGKYQKLFQGKVDALKYAKSLPGLKTVAVITGTFAEMLYTVPPFAGINFPEQGQLQYFGDIDNKFSTTSLVDVGKTIAALGTKRPEDVPEIINVAGEIVSPRILHETYEKVSGNKLELVGLPLEAITTPALKIVNEGPQSQIDFLTGLKGILYSGGMLIAPKDNSFVSQGLFQFATFEKVGETVPFLKTRVI